MTFKKRQVSKSNFLYQHIHFHSLAGGTEQKRSRKDQIKELEDDDPEPEPAKGKRRPSKVQPHLFGFYDYVNSKMIFCKQ